MSKKGDWHCFTLSKKRLNMDDFYQFFRTFFNKEVDKEKNLKYVFLCLQIEIYDEVVITFRPNMSNLCLYSIIKCRSF